jgi:hypothetical protein
LRCYLRLLQALSCFSRIPSSVAVILRDGIIAAARHRIDKIGLIAAGATRAFGGQGAGSSAGDATLFARERFNDGQWMQNRGNFLLFGVGWFIFSILTFSNSDSAKLLLWYRILGGGNERAIATALYAPPPPPQQQQQQQQQQQP